MAEFWLLTKVGVVIDVITKIGYGVVTLYVSATARRYIQDYRDSVESDSLRVDDNANN